MQLLIPDLLKSPAFTKILTIIILFLIFQNVTIVGWNNEPVTTSENSKRRGPGKAQTPGPGPAQLTAAQSSCDVGHRTSAERSKKV